MATVEETGIFIQAAATGTTRVLQIGGQAIPETVLLAVFFGGISIGSWLLSGYAGEWFLHRAADEPFWTWSIGHNLVFVARCVVLTGAIAVGLVVVGVDLLAVVGSPSIVALLLGIVLAPLVGLLMNGLALQYGRRFDEGDVIELQASGVRGIVDDFSLTHVKLITLDNEYLTIPTWKIRTKDIVNHSRNGDARRISVDMLVTYDSDVEAAKREVELAAQAVDDVVDAVRHPDYVVDEQRRIEIDDDLWITFDPTCQIRAFADSGISLRLYFWVNEPETTGRVKSNVLTEINEREGEDFRFAYPHVRVIGGGDNDEVELTETLDS
ncbi:mechanosensitive ion channel family protein [Haloarcula pellucida]|nr:mechanosensitive ion channel domain-containing protein [Halomicroarcula pellucida]MBX0348656.1 mechanosensitive ion channel family protein [Halomicroarcula pellucida]